MPDVSCTVAQLVALVPYSKKVLGLTPGCGSFCMVFACVGSHSGFLPQAKNMTVRLIGLSKLPLGMNGCMYGCLSCVSLCCPVMDWRPVQGVPCLLPIDAIHFEIPHHFN
ncbi:hypothetical protein XENOCAPTIV_024428 [Xenoophorus captivus]|uniref:Uncharacterized protein n=1 Tax=Xenoophorus captivus TaxID=1517983 RepID=A0ABV0QBI4_9TELE